jgi:hypothetical protein
VKLLVALYTHHVTIWCQNWLRIYTRENHAKNGDAADDGTPAERIEGQREAAEKRADDRFKAWREKMAARRGELVAKTEATREETRAIQARTEVTQAETEAIKARTAAMREKMGASHMEMVSEFKTEIEEETMACREGTEARLEEENPVSVYTKPPAAQQEEVPIVIPVGEPEEDMTSINRKKTMACHEMEERLEEQPTSVDRKPEAAEQREVLVENAEVMPVGEPKKKRRRDRKLAAERRRQKPKNSTRENCGPQKKLAVDRGGTTRRAKVARKTPVDRKMSRRATVARNKGDIVKSYLTQEKCHPRRKLIASRTRTTHRAGVARCKDNAVGKVRARDNVVRRTRKGWTCRRRQQMHKEGTDLTINRDFEERLRLGSERTTNGS